MNPSIPGVISYSFIDEISLIATTASIRGNITLLQKAVNELLQLGNRNTVKFDIEKTELIHFFINNKKLPSETIIINNKRIEAKKIIRWLGVYLDSRLTYKQHIKEKLLNAERAYYRLK